MEMGSVPHYLTKAEQGRLGADLARINKPLGETPEETFKRVFLERAKLEFTHYDNGWSNSICNVGEHRRATVTKDLHAAGRLGEEVYFVPEGEYSEEQPLFLENPALQVNVQLK